MEIDSYLHKRFAKAPFVVSRKIADKFILVPIRRKADEASSIFNMNEVGGCIWELIDGEKRLEEIRDSIIQEFQVDSERAGADLVKFIKRLMEIDVVREV